MSSQTSNKRKAGAGENPEALETEGDAGALGSTVRRGGRPGLRASNKTSHPGRVDISEAEDDSEKGQRTVKKARRSSEQVAAEKQAKAEEARKDAEENLQSRKKVAEIEDSLAEAAVLSRQTAACPPPGPITSKASRPVAELVAGAEESISGIERQAIASMPPHPGLGRRVSMQSAHSAKSNTDVSAEQVPIDDYDDGDREDDEDYDPATDKAGKPSDQYVDDRYSSDEELAFAPAVASPVRPKGRAKKPVQPTAREQIRAERSVPERSATTSSASRRGSSGRSSTVEEPSFLRESLPPPSISTSNRLPPSAAKKVGLSSRWETSSSASGHRARGPAKPQHASNASKASDVIDPEFSSKYGGLDDATEERERAPETAHRRPAKNQNIAAIVRGAPHKKLEASEPKPSKPKDTRTNSQLPHGTLSRWKDVLMPAWREWAGTVKNPWDTSDDILLSELSQLWGLVFPHIKLNLTADSTEYKLAKQRWYEWRGSIASAARKAVEEHLECLEADARVSEVEFLLDTDTVPFIWRNAEPHMDPSEYSGLFRSELVLRSLANHLTAIAPVPEKLQVNDVPRAALALAAAGVERALGFWKTGVDVFPDMKKEDRAFSETHCGATTTQFMKSIGQLSDRAWGKILTDAQEFVKEGSKKQCSSSDDLLDVPVTGRSCLYESDSDSGGE